MSLFPPSVEYALVDVPRSKGSKILVVDAVNGSDSNPGTKWEAPLANIEAAYAKCTTLKNDVVLLVANGTANTTTAQLAWAKNYTHLVGLCSPSVEPRSIVASAAALATTPFVLVSGSGCVIKNVTFSHNTTDALGLVCVSVTGSHNYFSNVHFSGGMGTNAITGARSLSIDGDSNRFDRCRIGQDSAALPNGAAGLVFLTDAAHNEFDDCMFLVTTAGTTYAHVLITAAADIGAANIFRRCLFINHGAGVQAEAFTIGAALTAPNRPFLLDSWLYGATEWETTNNGLVTNVTIAANHTGVATGNIMKITS